MIQGSYLMMPPLQPRRPQRRAGARWWIIGPCAVITLCSWLVVAYSFGRIYASQACVLDARGWEAIR